MGRLDYFRSLVRAAAVTLLLCPLASAVSQSESPRARPASPTRSAPADPGDRSVRDPVRGCRKATIGPQTVVFNANDPSDVARFDTWLHGTIDAVQLDGGRADWNDWLHSLDWLADLFSSSPTAIRWSVPLIPNGATLEAAAHGSYDEHYAALARQFTRHYGTAAPINIRLGWEFNGAGWNPWSAVGKPAQYRNAYRHFVTVFRSVGSNFVFEWTPNIGSVGMNPEEAYPGDDVVDLIGLDFYYNIQWDSRDPIAAWDYFVREKYGLQWHQTYAAAHHKPTAYAEWGVNSDAAGPFIARAAQWFRSHPVVYQNYWNSNSEFAGRLSDDQYPAAGAAYKAAFASNSAAAAVVSLHARTRDSGDSDPCMQP